MCAPRLRRFVLVALLALCPVTAWAQTCANASTEDGLDGSGTYVVTLSGAVSAGDALFVTIRQANTSYTITSISDSVNGSWTLTGGVVSAAVEPDGANRIYAAVRLNSGAGTPAITVVTSAGAGGQIRAWSCGASHTNTFEEWATPAQYAGFTSPMASPTGNATCSSGIAVVTFATSSSRSISSLDVGTQLSAITGRLHIAYLGFASSGSVGPISATLSSSSQGAVNLAVLCASGGGGGGGGGKNLTLLGVGP